MCPWQTENNAIKTYIYVGGVPLKNIALINILVKKMLIILQLFTLSFEIRKKNFTTL